MATETLNREELINEIWNQKGKVSLVGRALGCSVRTVYNYAERYATVQNALDQARQSFDEFLVDTAEVGLQKSVIDQEAWAVKYVLSTKGKNRGYVERQEVTGADGDPLRITVIDYGLDMEEDADIDTD